MERAASWPESAQDEAVASLEAIEDEYAGRIALSAEDRQALVRSAEDVRLGRFASDDAVRAAFDRHRK